jgi:hypothetical protein
VIAVLILSAFEAWRIQNSLSAQNLVIYRHYAEQDKALRILRFNLWQAGNYLRDLLIVSTPAQAAILHNQLDDLRAEDDRALQSFDRDAGRGAAIPKLRRSLGEFWNVANTVPDSMLNVSDQHKFQFLQREIVPRRSELYNAMLDLAAADQQKLEEGERDFADTRPPRRSAPHHHARRRRTSQRGGGAPASATPGASNRAPNAITTSCNSSPCLLHVEEEGRRRLSRELRGQAAEPSTRVNRLGDMPHDRSSVAPRAGSPLGPSAFLVRTDSVVYQAPTGIH